MYETVNSCLEIEYLKIQKVYYIIHCTKCFDVYFFCE